MITPRATAAYPPSGKTAGVKCEVMRLGSHLVIEWPIDDAQIILLPDGLTSGFHG